MSYEAVLLDNDGVLTELPGREALRRAAELTFSSFDLRRPTREDVGALVAGNVERIRHLCREQQVDASAFCLAAASHAVAEQKREFREGLRSLYDDVEALWAVDRRLGLVSNNQHEAVTFVLEHFGLEERFETVYGCPYTPEGLRRLKPNPYYLDRAMADLGTRDAVYVGDSAVDVEAATRAGIDSILLARDGDGDVPECTPTHRVESLGEVPALV